MKPIILLCSLLLAPLLAFEARCADSPAPHAADDRARLLEIDARWNAYRLSSDTEALSRLLREDFVLTHSDGRVESKTGYLADLRSGSRVNHAIENFDVELRIEGDAAVVTGRAVQRGVGDSGPFEGQFRFTRVWLRRDGSWQLLASHSSRLVSDAEAGR